jgi:hypothetical protein
VPLGKGEILESMRKVWIVVGRDAFETGYPLSGEPWANQNDDERVNFNRITTSMPACGMKCFPEITYLSCYKSVANQISLEKTVPRRKDRRMLQRKALP